VRALDQPPEPEGFERVVHHGARLGLLLAVAVAIFLLFPAPRLPDAAVLEPGVIAPQDVIAEFSFDIPKSPEELLQAQMEAASGVPPVYTQSPATRDSVVAELRTFFAGLDSVATASAPAERREAVRRYLQSGRIYPTASALDILEDARRRADFRRAVEEVVRDLYPRGIAPSSVPPGVTSVKVRSPEGVERLVPRDSLLTPDRFFTVASERLTGGQQGEAELERLLLIRFFRPNLALDERATASARQRARAAVNPIKGSVLRGEKIVGAHEKVGEDAAARLKAYQDELTRRGVAPDGSEHAPGRGLGAILYNLLVLGTFGALLFFYRAPLYRDWRALVLFALLVVAVAAAGAVIARLELHSELIPVTFASLIVAVLWDGRLGLTLALILALLIGGQTPLLGVTAPFTAAMGGAAAALSVRIVRRRSKTWLFISVISLAYVASAITMGLLRSRSLEEVGISVAFGIGNALVASLLAIGFLPLLESFTGITTDQTLLELSDPNRALLKRLQLEAPGTYAHTVNVANLAEAACHAIDANGLLARVGAYYHDIGKLVKPQYFIENQHGRNPHDKLKPSISSGIIRSHVQEGLRLVEAEGLPEAVKRFIPEHHGTQQIAYFLNRAKELDPQGHVNTTEFAYVGPKPQTKETAVLMLSDSVESAAHVLQDPTPTRIRELVDRIVGQKMAEGQLDESPLTLRELGLIKDSLASVLTGMYHHRIDYPAAPPPERPAAPVAATPAESEVAETPRG
jgi:putative nucleotidyltransferase with HDIG domain